MFFSPLFSLDAAAGLDMSFHTMADTAVIPYYSGWNYIFGLTLIVAFLDAYGIGANDVANSFATSVGSGSLTLRQATCIAIVTEFLGAVLLGKTTADTVRNKIVNTSLFASNPGLLMLGMFCALCGSATWVLAATRLGFPVSTTHSIVGAIMGIGIAAFGQDGVLWKWNGGGFAQIAASWFISPAVAGILGAFLWLLTEFTVLRHPDSFRRALISVPFYTFGTVSYIVFAMAYKGIPRTDAEKDLGGVGQVVALSLGIGAGVTLIVIALLPTLKRHIEAKFDAENAAKAAAANASSVALVVRPPGGGGDGGEQPPTGTFTDAEKAMNDGSGPASPTNRSTMDLVKVPAGATSSMVNLQEAPKSPTTGKAWSEMSAFERAKHLALRGVDVDVVSHPELSEMHAASRKFDRKAELLYSFLQVLTATFASFAHGSNDIANACGPLATVYAIYDSDHYQYNVKGSNEVPVWILAFCGIALDIGLATYGYNIMRELGNKITYHSPARGFIMELSAGVAVLFASKQGWPISTTHCITGATIMVGFVSGDRQAVNWKRAALYMLAWIITLPVAGLLAGLFFSLIAFAPKGYTLKTTI